MKKIVLGVVAVAALGGGAWYYKSGSADAAAAAVPNAGGGGAGGRGGRGRGAAGTLTVDTAAASRNDLVDYVTVVGNLIGEATVDVVPRVAGRLELVAVKLGDRVTKGQLLAKVEDREIREQVNQSQANLEVNHATVISRENDLRVAENAFERAKTSYERGLLSKQGLEDAEARYNSSVSQVTVAKAQAASTQARLDELKVNLSNTSILAPMDGVVGRRNLDPGGFAGGNTVVASIVDISTVRLIANLVEKDFRRVGTGSDAVVEVDAFPEEQFTGQVSRVAPIFDPATRTASIEIEVQNPGFRLKPGMYARVRLTAEERTDALTVPRDAVVDSEGRHGVYLIEGDVAKFHDVRTGISDGERVEVLDGLTDGTRVVTVGALAIRDGDRVIVGGAAAAGRGGRTGGRGRGGAGGQAQPASATGGGAAAPSATRPAAAPDGSGRRGQQIETGPAPGTPDTPTGGRRGGRSGRGGRQSGGSDQQSTQ